MRREALDLYDFWADHGGKLTPVNRYGYKRSIHASATALWSDDIDI